MRDLLLMQQHNGKQLFRAIATQEGPSWSSCAGAMAGMRP